MDEQDNIHTGKQPAGESDSLTFLKRIPLVPEYAPRIEWLWSQLKTQDYAFDDFTRGNSQFWINKLGQPNSEHFELGDDGYVVADNIIPGANANVHFAVWGQRAVVHIVHAAAKELLTYLFTKYNLVRVTGTAPVNNRNAIRLATILRFKYEGALRKAFLFHGTWYDITIYGILREEFMKKETVN